MLLRALESTKISMGRSRSARLLLHSSLEVNIGALMCRNIRTLFNFEPPASNAEIEAAALQYVRKLSGYNAPSQANQQAFDLAVQEVTAVSTKLLASLTTRSMPRNREIEREKAKARSAARFNR